MDSNFAGVDFGAKYAGTTAICYRKGNILHIQQTIKGEDADKWLKDKIQNENISTIYIDAPLSLPSAYYGKGSDFGFREADRALRAMSPMFLGGLTARSMSLAASLNIGDVSCIEVYPEGFVKSDEEISDLYIKKDLNTLVPFYEVFKKKIDHELSDVPTNYHQLDSLISWYIGSKYVLGKATSFGHASEGQIWI